MSRLSPQRTVGGLFLALGLAAFAAGARAGDPPSPTDKDAPPKSQPAKDDDASKTKRLLYLVKHGAAKDLAAVLGEHFKGVAEVQALPASASNCLLISASPTAFDEVVKVLEQLDRPPQVVSLEVTLVEVAAPKADGDKPESGAPALDEKQFTGPITEVEAKLEALRKKGVLGDVKRVQLTVVEGLPTSVMTGESRPYVVGINITAKGSASRSIAYRDMGVLANATLHVSPDKVISVDLKFQESHPFVAEDGIPIGNDENGKPVRATEFVLTDLNSKLSIPSGQTVAAQGMKKTTSKFDKTQTLILVGARVMEPDAPPEK